MSARAVQERERAAKAIAALGPATTTLLLIRHGETSWNAEGRLQGQLFPGPSLSAAGAAQARALGAALAEGEEETRRTERTAAAAAAAKPAPPAPESAPAAPPAPESAPAAPAAPESAATAPIITAVYSSDLARAVETAELVAAALALAPAADRPPTAPPVVVVQLPALRERDLGSQLEGVRRADAYTVAPEAFSALRRGVSNPSEPLPGGGESLDALASRVGRELVRIASERPGERVVVVSHGGAMHAARRYAEGAPAAGEGGGFGGGRSSFSPLPNGALCEFRIDGEAAARCEAAAAAAAAAGGGGNVGGGARARGGQWRHGWAIARWADGGLLGSQAAGTAGGGADAG